VGRKRKEPYRNGDVGLGRSDGWWVADYRDGSSRKRSRLIRLDRTEQDAKAALDKFAEARRAVTKAQRSYTVGDLWKLWLADREKDGLSNDIYNANWVALKKFFENRAPHLLTRDDGREYARARFDLGRAPATVNTELSRLRACLQWAVDTNLISKPQKIWVPGAGKPRDRVLTPEEAFQLVLAARNGDPHIYLFVVLAFSTGGRHTAILDLMWDRIDFVRGTIDLEVDLPPDPMTKRKRKGRAHIVMSNLARPALEEAFAGRTKCGYVIEHGGHRLKGVGEGFYNAVKRAGLGEWKAHPEKPDVMIFETDVTPHTIRHTVATWADSKDVDTKHTAQLLGHKDENTTRKVYTHRDPEASKPAVDVIDATFAELPDLAENRNVAATKRGKKQRRLSTVDR
jgi:integrase